MHQGCCKHRDKRQNKHVGNSLIYNYLQGLEFHHASGNPEDSQDNTGDAPVAIGLEMYKLDFRLLTN